MTSATLDMLVAALGHLTGTPSYSAPSLRVDFASGRHALPAHDPRQQHHLALGGDGCEPAVVIEAAID